jgi:hypothetical protein
MAKKEITPKDPQTTTTEQDDTNDKTVDRKTAFGRYGGRKSALIKHP